VINEANVTFTGKEKQLYFQENRQRFKKWDDKIIHNVIIDNNDNFENYIDGKLYHRPLKEDNIYKLPMHYQRDVFHRDSCIYGILQEAQDDDIIFTSDADEIANPLVVERMGDWFDRSNHYVMVGPCYYYYLNVQVEDNWMGTRVCTLEHLKTTSIDKLRQSHKDAWKIMSGGWHWSFFGGADRVRAKIEAYAHQEHNIEQLKMSMESRIENNEDPCGRDYFKLRTVPIDNSFPEYIQYNKNKLLQYIKK
jgi:beta-1,4-mannosyl-glycoprotein beta-1,4-N-acetylglucosaminyltransferase